MHCCSSYPVPLPVWQQVHTKLFFFFFFFVLDKFLDFKRDGFPGRSAGKESTCNAGDLGSIPELGRSPGEGKSYPLQYSDLENSTDCIVHWVAKSQT